MNPAHLVLSTVGRDPMFLEAAARRVAVRTLARVAGDSLWLFGFADDHVHLVVTHEEPRVLGGRLALAFAALPGAPALQRAWAEPVDGRAHLLRLVPYLLRQSEHHGLGPSVTWEGSCFLDLVGGRLLEGFGPRAWRTGLPRESESIVWDAVGLERPAGVPVAGLSLGALCAAATRVVAADPSFAGRTPEVVRARRVAVALALEAGFRPDTIAGALKCSASQVRRLASQRDEDAVRAARRGLAIDAAVARLRLRAA